MTTNNLVTIDYLDKKFIDLRKDLKKNFVTKNYLDKKLEVFVTKNYLDKKLEVFVTKNYLGRKFVRFEKQINYKMDKRFKEFKNEFLNIQDKILTELQAFREDFKAHQFSHMRIDETIEELQTKIKKL